MFREDRGTRVLENGISYTYKEICSLDRRRKKRCGGKNGDESIGGRKNHEGVHEELKCVVEE